MTEYLPSTYGDRIADQYDAMHPAIDQATIELLGELANTIFALQSQEEQVQCFRTVARHLQPDGCFLIEAFVPDLARFDRDQRVSVRSIDTDSAMLELSRHDPVLQRVESQLVHVSSRGVQLYPVQLRYAWPSELDLMARLADLTLIHRWANWRREPFGATSGFHLSVYRRRS